MCLEVIEVRAKIMIAILGPIGNIIGKGGYSAYKMFAFIMNKMFVRAPKIMMISTTTLSWIC